MKREYLELKTCHTEKAEFIRGKEYIVLGTTTDYTYEYECEIFPYYKVINERGAVEIVVPEQIFYPNSRLLQAVKAVVYLGISDIESLKEDEVYSVFKISEENGETLYSVFDDSNKLKTYSLALFVPEEQYQKMTKEELSNLKKCQEEAFLKVDALRKQEMKRVMDEQLEIENAKRIAIQKDLDEKNRLKSIEQLNKLEIEKIREFIKILRPKVVENTTTPFNDKSTQNSNKINKLTLIFIVVSFVTVLCSLFGKVLLSSIINILYLLVGVLIYFKLKNKLAENSVKYIPESKIIDKENLRLMISFSDEILLKLKKIELNLLILEGGTTISSGAVPLIRESVSFCLESYRSKDSNLLKDIDVFLDKTLEYIYSLIESDNSEELYIEKKIYENVSSIINRNTNVFELMTSDNKKIKEILSKDRIFK